MQWLEGYTFEDLTIAELKGSSNSLWTISPPSRTNLIEMLSTVKEEFPVTVSWSVQRYANPHPFSEVSGQTQFCPSGILAP